MGNHNRAEAQYNFTESESEKKFVIQKHFQAEKIILILLSILFREQLEPLKKLMEYDKEKIADEILNKSFKDGEKVKIPCAAALLIAKQYGVNPSVIGSISNELDIRITRCQLGCFP